MYAKIYSMKHWKHLRVLLGIGLMLLAAAACTPGQEAAADQQPTLSFETQIAVHEGYNVDIALGVKNESRRPFEGDKQFNAQMQLTNLETEKLRATANIVSIDRVEPGETAWIMDWNGDLDPGRYRLTWGAEGYNDTAYAEFSVGPENVEETTGDPPPEAERPDLDPLLTQARADLADP